MNMIQWWVALVLSMEGLSAVDTQRARDPIQLFESPPNPGLDLVDLGLEDPRPQSGYDEVSWAVGKQHQQKLVEFLCRAVAYPLIAFVSISIVAIYRPFGIGSVVIIALYMFSLVVIRLQLKDIFTNYNFKYPITLTVIHLVMSGAVAGAVFRLKHSDESVDWRERKWGLIVISSCVGGAILFNNMSLVAIGAALNAMVAATGCTVQITMLKLRGIIFPAQCWVAVTVAATGVIVMAHAQSHTTATGQLSLAMFLGMSMAFASTVSRCVRGYLQQKLLDPKSISHREGTLFKNVHPLQLVSWTCPMSAAMMMPLAYHAEGIASFHRLAHEGSLALVILASCATATMINVGSSYATKLLGAAGALNVGQLTLVLTTVIAIPVNHERMTWWGFIGLALTVTGSYWFESQRRNVRNQDGEQTYKSHSLEVDSRSSSQIKAKWVNVQG